MSIKTQISRIHYDKNAKGHFFNILKFCSVFYGIASGIKNSVYDKKILNPQKVGAYVISVGNFTTGGVGKTPVVAQIANYFAKKGEKVAILSRGYGARLSNKKVNVVSDGENIYFNADLAGDEPVWLAENTKNVCVLTCRNRIKAAEYAIKEFKATKLILDDGFQHRKLARDLDVVLIDSEMGFGNENLLPAGPLREGPEAFNRVNKLVVVSKNIEHARAEKYAKIMGKKLKKDTVVCYVEPEKIYDIFDTKKELKVGEKVLAFSAIGQPNQFYKFLTNFDVVESFDFDDHHNYSQEDVDGLIELCRQKGIEKMITTEKDAGKLLKLDFKGFNVFALKLQTRLDLEILVG